MIEKPQWIAVALGCAFSLAAPAQQYPNRAIRFITVGADDAMPRLLAQELSGTLGQQVYIEEHAGASGTIGAEVASRAPADGYTFMVATSTHMVTPHFYKLTYDIQRDFEPVSMLASTPFVLLAHPSLPVTSLQGLIKLAKASPGKLNYSATATGSTSMLSCELFKAAAGVNIVHVPYKSIAAALIDAVAGQVPLTMSVTPNALSQIKAGRVRALAVTTPKRSAALPDVPAFTELGLPVALPAWFGLLAPAKTAPAIVIRMNAEVVKALRKPAIRERVLSFALDPGENTPEEFTAFMKADMARWTDAVKAAKLDKVLKQ
jgi:tripartite-type tricarboxylate transporter receptor subunit TctC